MSEDLVTDGTVLHGGAQRINLNVLNPDVTQGLLSCYKIAPNDSCGLHVHAGKSECWLVVRGRGHVQYGDERMPMGPGDMLTTPPGIPHALENTGDDDLVFVNLVIPSDDGSAITTSDL